MNPVLPTKETSFNQAQLDEIKALIKAELEKSADVKVWKYKELEVDKETNETKVKVSYSKAKLPVKKHTTDTGFDVYVCFDDTTLAASEAQGKKEPDPIILYPGKTLRIPTGVCVRIPEGYEIQCRPRSGCSADGCAAILGSVDQDYTGHIQILACNTSNEHYEIHHGDRIAQLVVAKRCNATMSWGEGEGPEKTERGANGFGSSGK